MKMTNQEYGKMVGKASPPSPKVKDFVWAFVVGGLICTLGQLLHDLYGMAGMNEEQVKMAVPVTLIFLSALTTGLQLFDKLAKHAGAGTLVPITGLPTPLCPPLLSSRQRAMCWASAPNFSPSPVPYWFLASRPLCSTAWS